MLERFLKAQEKHYASALREIIAGEKRSHWMWFIFPQLRGLGRSRKAYVYGIIDLNEAKAYLAHPVLGERLRQCTRALLAQTDRTAVDMFGGIDALKLRSCMTLFALAEEGNSVFREALERYFDGKLDPLTEALVSGKATDVTFLKYNTAFISNINL